MSDDKLMARRKVSPVFVTGDGEPSAEYMPSPDHPLARQAEPETAESPEAATHWDARRWRPV